MSSRSPLFNKVRIFDVLLHQKELFKDAFRKVSNAELDANTEGVVSRLVEQCGINVPLLHDENKHALTKETQVDVSRDPMRRFIYDAYDSGPRYVAATEITFVIPFDGDAALFDVQPSTFT